jgi:hypothetical protein
MAITTEQRISGVKTRSQPAITARGDEYVLAWTNEDGTISWTTLKVNQAGNGYDRGSIMATGFRTTFGNGPALTTFEGTVWLAWLEDQADAPWIEPFKQRRQPPVIMVASLSGTTWSHSTPVWNPGLTGTDLWVQGYQGPAAVSSPAMAATGTEMFLAWCEYATNGSDALAILTGGQSNLPSPQDQIFFSKSSDGTSWSTRVAVKGAITQHSPALVGLGNEDVYMTWQGQEPGDGSIWFAQYTDSGGWGKGAKLPGYATSNGPALGVDDAGNVHMAWKGGVDTKMYGATLAAGTSWSPQTPGKGWSAEAEIPVETGWQPAMASQLSGSAALALSFKGGSSTDVYVMPLDAFKAVAAPSAGLGSNSNYILANNCHDLKNVSVTIDISEEMVLESVGPPAPGYSQVQGFSFQLNAVSPPSFTPNCALQQYVIIVVGNQLQGQINNYKYGPYGPHNGIQYKQLNLQNVTLGSLASANKLPKGYKLSISLVYGQNEIITGAVFNVQDNHGRALPTVTIQISGVPPQGLAPIIAFELDIVGPGNGEAAVFSSGGGTISYSASSPLGFLSTNPNNCGITLLSGGGTLEQGNTSYEVLTVYRTNPIVQQFKLASPDAPQIHRFGKTRPPTPVK